MMNKELDDRMESIIREVRLLDERVTDEVANLEKSVFILKGEIDMLKDEVKELGKRGVKHDTKHS